MTSPKKVPFTKPPKTFDEQVQKLKDHGLDVSDPAGAAFYLSQLNYYRLAAYCLPFEQDHATHQFQSGARFEDVLNLYFFDRELRLLTLDAIERIEVSLRTQMAYHFSHNHATAHPHLLAGNFSDPVTYGGLITKLANDVAQSKEDFIKHLTRKYEEPLPPVWAVVELMTIGQLSKWFSAISARSDRQDISRIYGLDEKVMTSFCQHLSLVRNHAAHHSRLWNRDFTKTMMLPHRGPDTLVNSLQHLPDSDRRLRKISNTFVMIAYLMDVISSGHHWKQRLKDLISRHSIDTQKMGFPADWQERPIWQLV